MTCQQLCFRGLIGAYLKAIFLIMHCKMKQLASRFLIAMSIAIYFASNAQGEPARLLLKFNKTRKTFELNQTALVELSHLQRPVRVIAVVGDARIGKSTTMNLISHLWTKVNRNKLEEIFETGDTLDPVTHDVWCHIIHDERGGNVVLLDVEGTNLSDDALTTQLSMFTALISSGLNVLDRKSTRLNSSHMSESRMPSSA